jgi:hypothetical protein
MQKRAKQISKPQHSPRNNTKLIGERSEAAFLNRAASLGFGVAKPWGDSLRYDFILDNGERLIRVQIKCTASIRAQAYETRATYTVGNGRAVYTRADIDFLAAHVVPLDLWYILPVEVCTPAPMLRFYPHRQAKQMRLEKYREAWHLMQSTSGRTLIDLHASADETEMIHGGADAENEHGGADALVRPISDAHVGTAALGCPAERSSAPLATYPILTWLVPRPEPR